MSDPSPKGLDLTPDLIEYAKAVAIQAAKHCCGPRIVYDDAVGQAMLHLLGALPKYDPSKRAAPKTWINTVVTRSVMKYADREQKKLDRMRSFGAPTDDQTGPTEHQETTLARWHGRWPADHEAAAARVEEAIDLIDDEDARRMCRLLIEHNGNRSAVAREMSIDEGVVRYRIKRVLRPRLEAMGFDFLGEGDTP